MAPVGDRRHNGVLFVPQLLISRVSIGSFPLARSRNTYLQECPKKDESF